MAHTRTHAPIEWHAPVGVVELRDELLELVHVRHVAQQQHVAGAARLGGVGEAGHAGPVLGAGGEDLFLFVLVGVIVCVCVCGTVCVCGHANVRDGTQREREDARTWKSFEIS